jgi:hypothetical protein
MAIRMILMLMAASPRAEDAPALPPFDASQYPPELRCQRRMRGPARRLLRPRLAVVPEANRIAATRFAFKIPD